jgi:hypothetical protein
MKTQELVELARREGLDELAAALDRPQLDGGRVVDGGQVDELVKAGRAYANQPS